MAVLFVLLKVVFRFFIFFLIAAMLVDIRNRSSSKATPIPPNYKAFIYRFHCIDTYEFKVVIAKDKLSSDSFMKQFVYEQSLENVFYSFVCEDDFSVAGIAGDAYYKSLFE